jgi:hypothetical protein
MSAVACPLCADLRRDAASGSLVYVGYLKLKACAKLASRKLQAGS